MLSTSCVSPAHDRLAVRQRTARRSWQELTNDVLNIQSSFAVQERTVVWKIQLQNQTARAIEVRDLAVPLPISRGGRQRGNFDPDANDAVILKHQFISGPGSFFFFWCWGRTRE